MKYTLFAFAAILIFSNRCCGQKIKPLLNLKTGSIYKISYTDSSSVTRMSNGLPNNIDVVTSCKIKFKITDYADSVYQAKASYSSLSLNISLPDTNFEMNSTPKSKTDTPSVLISAIINHPIAIAFTAKGYVKSVADISRFADSALNLFQGIDTAKKRKIIESFLRYFGSNTLKMSIEQWAKILPDTAIAKFGKWKTTRATTIPMPAKIMEDYQIAGISADNYRIIGTGTVSAATKDTIEINNIQAKYTLNGMTLTDATFDSSTGWPIQYKYRQLADGNVIIPGETKATPTATIPLISHSEITISGE